MMEKNKPTIVGPVNVGGLVKGPSIFIKKIWVLI
jgi:hypothetical protein